MTGAPVYVRRDVTEWSRKHGWRWTCRICVPVRGRTRGGFHRDHRWTDQRRPDGYVDAWTRCMHAAIRHIHVHHRYLTVYAVREQP